MITEIQKQQINNASIDGEVRAKLFEMIGRLHVNGSTTIPVDGVNGTASDHIHLGRKFKLFSLSRGPRTGTSIVRFRAARSSDECRASN